MCPVHLNINYQTFRRSIARISHTHRHTHSQGECISPGVLFVRCCCWWSSCSSSHSIPIGMHAQQQQQQQQPNDQFEWLSETYMSSWLRCLPASIESKRQPGGGREGDIEPEWMTCQFCPPNQSASLLLPRSAVCVCMFIQSNSCPSGRSHQLAEHEEGGEEHWMCDQFRTKV